MWGTTMLTELEGQIERITYTNDENGYTIARVKVSGQRDLVTVVGTLMAPMPGEVVRLRGEWSNHPRYGQQFKIVDCKTTVPATVEGIQKYLGSGLIKGIGPVMAGRIVKEFGKDTLEVIENKVEILARINGIGKRRTEMIRRAWEEQKEIREVMLFLQSHGVSAGYATKIFKRYGDRSIQVVRQNPYRLASDIFGIGFLTADEIASKLGFSKDSHLRAEAGILYVLQQVADEGNVYFPYEPLLGKCQEMLEADPDVLAKALGSLAFGEGIVIEDLNRGAGDYRENNKAVYLRKFYLSEINIAASLKALLRAPKSIRNIDPEKALAWVQDRLSITLAEKQMEAVRRAAENKILVITGGPGTGKTTIIKAILKIFSMLGVKIMLSAPTGRAAKRMGETTGFQAKTIHRMLEYSIQKGGFQRNEERPLDCDLLIVDEASMIDTVLMHHLLKAVPSSATFILVGDVNQLPSVGAGNVLNDVISSGKVPVVELNKIFRQAKESLIVVNAHKINNGILPSLGPPGPRDDFYFIEKEDPEDVLKIIVELTKERVPRQFGFDPVEEIQVLTPMHKGVVGAGNLNTELQKSLNPQKNGLVRGNRVLLVGDKVMQIRNNYDKEVFNGDMGRIARIDLEDQEVIISFEGREVAYDYGELDEIVLAYAVSVHKSQGSEYPAVIVPVLTQHYVLLQRNLIYTAVTRGRKLVILIGTKRALAIAVRNNKTQMRYTRLRERLSGNLKLET